MLSYLEGGPDLPLLIVGDFNCWLNPYVDKNPIPQAPNPLQGTPLLRLLNEMGWVDIWRHNNPLDKQFSCFSKTYGTLSRIDLAVGNLAMLPYVSGVMYKLCSVSNHLHVVAVLIVSPPSKLSRHPGNLTPFG